MKKRKTIILSLLLMMMMCTVVSADERKKDLTSYGTKVGEIKFNVRYANGMRDCYAWTYPEGTAKHSYTRVLVTYTDGTEQLIVDGPKQQYTVISRNYEWSEDYVATHKVWKTMSSLPLATQTWSDN